MRDDCIAIFVSGQDFSSGNDTPTEFGDSPLFRVCETFAARYPDINFRGVTWHQPLTIPALIAGKKALVIGHSFGAVRALHSIFAASEVSLSIDVILIDPVRYNSNAQLDPAGDLYSIILAQKFDRMSLPVPAEAESCTAFLREGGEWLGAFPESSPIVTGDSTRKNVYVPDVDHNSIIFSDPVQAAIWTVADELFKVAA